MGDVDVSWHATAGVASVFKFKINDSKSLFFTSDLEKAGKAGAKRALSKAGAFVRTTARNSMRPARQKPVASLTDKERRRFERAKKDYAAGRTKFKPKRPLIGSKAGEPPRTRVGYIKKFLFFVYDPETKSVVVGPAVLNAPTGAPSILESGGTVNIGGKSINLAPRPFMQPAYKKNQKTIVEAFRDSIRR